MKRLVWKLGLVLMAGVGLILLQPGSMEATCGAPGMPTCIVQPGSFCIKFNPDPGGGYAVIPNACDPDDSSEEAPCPAEPDGGGDPN